MHALSILAVVVTLLRIHQDLDIGQGKVDRDTRFGTLTRLKFDGVMTVCIFCWEERVRESSTYNLDEIRRRMGSASAAARRSRRTRSEDVRDWLVVNQSISVSSSTK